VQCNTSGVTRILVEEGHGYVFFGGELAISLYYEEENTVE